MNMRPGKDSPSFRLLPGKVHIWVIDLERIPREWLGQGAVISNQELVHSRTFKVERERQRYIARRAMLRQLLGRYSGLDPMAIQYQVNPYGKLSLLDSALAFSLAGCQDRMAIAFALGAEVGVDLEHTRPLADIPSLVARWFSSEEQAGWSDLPAEKQTEAFYHIWTQKEAFIKATGRGMSFPLKDLSVEGNPDMPPRLVSIESLSDGDAYWMPVEAWKMDACQLEGGWRLAVCVRSEQAHEVLLYMPDKWDWLVN
jgi:4'-phosphopantetheinyl transferase